MSIVQSSTSGVASNAQATKQAASSSKSSFSELLARQTSGSSAASRPSATTTTASVAQTSGAKAATKTSGAASNTRKSVAPGSSFHLLHAKGPPSALAWNGSYFVSVAPTQSSGKTPAGSKPSSGKAGVKSG